MPLHTVVDDEEGRCAGHAADDGGGQTGVDRAQGAEGGVPGCRGGGGGIDGAGEVRLEARLERVERVERDIDC